MSSISALRRVVVVTAASSLVISAALVAGSQVANAAETPRTGGTLVLLEHEPRLDH